MADPLDRVRDADSRSQLYRIRELYGRVVLSSTLQDEIRGFSGQRGIYKPAGNTHARWVRETRRGAYKDKRPRDGTDGSWTYLYSPEFKDGRVDLGLDTNKALLRCMEDGQPVGVFRQTEDIRGRAAYEVLGLAYVRRLEGEHFVLQGEPIDWTADPAPESVVPKFAPFEIRRPKLSITTRLMRDRRFAVVLNRIYREKCGLCKLGFQVQGQTVGLDAAHIIPVEEGGVIGDVRNGILLCKNHHALYDQFAWTFDEDLRVVVPDDRAFRESAASNHILALAGKRLQNLPEDSVDYPASDAIKWRTERFESTWT
jgi:hypothetical protein